MDCNTELKESYLRDKWPFSPLDQPTWLYRHYSLKGELLYVGIAGSARKRTAEHYEKDWFLFSRFMFLEFFPARGLAREAERYVIEHENPRANTDRELPTGIPPIYHWYLDEKDGLVTGDLRHWANPDCPRLGTIDCPDGLEEPAPIKGKRRTRFPNPSANPGKEPPRYVGEAECAQPSQSDDHIPRYVG